MKYRITISADGFIADLKRLVSQKTGLSTTKVIPSGFFFEEFIQSISFQMLAYKFPNHRSIEYLKDADSIQSSSYSWSNSDTIYMYAIICSSDKRRNLINFLV